MEGLRAAKSAAAQYRSNNAQIGSLRGQAGWLGKLAELNSAGNPQGGRVVGQAPQPALPLPSGACLVII